jgi:flagellar biogenesis protein FliO
MSTPWIFATAFAASAAVVCGALRLLALRPKGSPAEEEAPLRVVTRTRVGIGRTLVLVEADGRRFLLGSTRDQWCALADLGRAGAAETEAVMAGIEEELKRASDAARHRRLKS